MTSYIMSNAWEGERRRLAGMEARYDAGTFRHLAALGVSDGWRCWDVGAGGGTVAAWLCDRVAPSGSVLATDLDTRFVEQVAHPNLEMRQHDVVRDPLPEGGFDLIHTRLLLMHLPERDAVVGGLASALRPGGWLLLEEWVEAASLLNDPEVQETLLALSARPRAAIARYQESQQVSQQYGNYGRLLYGRLRAAGLVDLGAEGRTTLDVGGPDFVDTTVLANPDVRATVVAQGDVTDEEIEALQAFRRSPAFFGFAPVMIAAWGRRLASSD
jgi:SAM-dependent methyltransferase